MLYITFLVLPFLLYSVGTILMGRRFYHQADATGVEPGKAISAAGFGLTAFLGTMALWEFLSVPGKLEHVLAVTGAVAVGLTTQWVMSKLMIPDQPSDPNSLP